MNARQLARSHPAPSPTDEVLAGTAEVVLLSTDGADFRRVAVDAASGVLTLYGTVRTQSEKLEAAAAVRDVDGVVEVNNLLEVSPDVSRPSRVPPPRFGVMGV